MKAATLSIFLILAMLAAWPAAAETVEVSGTWSGNWVTQGGVWNAVTVQFVQQDSGKLTGKFLTPVQMDFKKLSFDPKTGKILLEAVDETSGKNYKLDAKFQGTELKGTLTANEMTGEMLLIKWTYVPR
jgi:hypothetical protein